MTNGQEHAIRFENVNYSAGGTTILKNISGFFPKGKITAIAGPSGSGKSTLFRLCNGLSSPDSGNIYILGKHINEYRPVELRRTVGLALQNAPMIDGTVMDNLSLPLELRGKRLDEKEGKRLLSLVGLGEHFLMQNARDLSGGERQKVSIARTLVNRPKILLLDEITSALDRVSQQEIEKLVLTINREFGTTIVWITHNLDEAKAVGDYMWIMMEGEIAETGDISILEAPKNERVKQFLKGVKY